MRSVMKGESRQADVSDDLAGRRQAIEAVEVGALVEVAALFEALEKVRSMFAHGACGRFKRGEAWGVGTAYTFQGPMASGTCEGSRRWSN